MAMPSLLANFNKSQKAFFCILCLVFVVGNMINAVFSLRAYFQTPTRFEPQTSLRVSPDSTGFPAFAILVCERDGDLSAVVPTLSTNHPLARITHNITLRNGSGHCSAVEFPPSLCTSFPGNCWQGGCMPNKLQVRMVNNFMLRPLGCPEQFSADIPPPIGLTFYDPVSEYVSDVAAAKTMDSLDSYIPSLWKNSMLSVQAVERVEFLNGSISHAFSGQLQISSQKWGYYRGREMFVCTNPALCPDPNCGIDAMCALPICNHVTDEQNSYRGNCSSFLAFHNTIQEDDVTLQASNGAFCICKFEDYQTRDISRAFSVELGSLGQRIPVVKEFSNLSSLSFLLSVFNASLTVLFFFFPKVTMWGSKPLTSGLTSRFFGSNQTDQHDNSLSLLGSEN